MKSYLTLTIGFALATGVELPGGIVPDPGCLGDVGVLDWETNGGVCRRRLSSTAGALGLDERDVLPRFFYRRMAGPLVDNASELRSIIARHKIRTVIIDSWRMACGLVGAGDPNDCIVSAYTALRTFEVTPIIVAHPPKDGNGVYGGSYSENEARSLVRVRLVSDPKALEKHIVLEHEKLNEGPTAAPIGLAFVFTRPRPDDYPVLTKIATHDRTADPGAHWTLADKIEALLLQKRRQMLVADIAMSLGCSVLTGARRGSASTSARRRGMAGKSWTSYAMS